MDFKGIAGINHLAMKIKTVISVNWLTYSWNHQDGQLGLGDYLAEKIGCSEIDLCCSNDTDFGIDLSPAGSATAEIDKQEQETLIARLRSSERGNGLEDYELQTLIEAAVERNWLPRADYVIKVSW